MNVTTFLTLCIQEPSARSGAGLGISPALRSPASPTFNAPANTATGAVQHETLQNFFQSLLQTNNRGARPIPGGSRSGTPTVGTNPVNGVDESGSNT